MPAPERRHRSGWPRAEVRPSRGSRVLSAPMRRNGVVAGVVLVMGAAGAGAARAAELRVRAPDRCVEAGAVAEQVSGLLGQPLGSIPGVDFELEIAPAPPGGWRLRLDRIDAAAPGSTEGPARRTCPPTRAAGSAWRSAPRWPACRTSSPASRSRAASASRRVDESRVQLDVHPLDLYAGWCALQRMTYWFPTAGTYVCIPVAPSGGVQGVSDTSCMVLDASRQAV